MSFLLSLLVVPLLAIHVLWVNLITDSLPAVALGADDKEAGIMNDKPRDPKDSLFAHGGYAITFGYGVVITIATLFAFLYMPIFGMETLPASLDDVALRLAENPQILMISQTMAFCTLAMSELFHMLGMTSMRKSFIHNFKSKNWLLWVSFVVGMGLQVFVVLVPYVNDFFKCASLNLNQWLIVLALSVLPLVIHEIIALILFIRRVSKRR